MSAQTKKVEWEGRMGAWARRPSSSLVAWMHAVCKTNDCCVAREYRSMRQVVIRGIPVLFDELIVTVSSLADTIGHNQVVVVGAVPLDCDLPRASPF